MREIAEYFRTHTDEYFLLIVQHIGVSLLAVAASLAIAVPLGVLGAKNRRLAWGFEKGFGILRLVPSLAILLLCIPIIGTGLKPTVLALTILAIPPVLINTTQAFVNLPAETIEAAVGMGMGAQRVFWRIKLPLAFPILYAGIRTAVIEVIASATLAAYIGAGGLGNIIFTGLGLMRVDLLLIGGGSVAVLSLVAGSLLDRGYDYLTRYQNRNRRSNEMRRTDLKRKIKYFAAFTATVAVITGILAGCGTSASGSQGSIRVGSKDFTENEIVAEIYALALEEAGYKVERIFDVGSSVIHTSITSDEIDLYPEYTGTGLISVLGEAPLTDAQEVYETVKAAYDEKFQITWLDYSEANDGQGLVIRTEVAQEFGIWSISDLQAHASEIRFASQGEFDEREDGIPGLEKVYGTFPWKSSKVYDNSLKYEVLASNEADVSPAYTTEGRLTEDQFTLLEDDKHVWPPYNLAPVVRNEILEANPEIAEILNKVSATFTTENITALNARVDIDGEEYQDVAKEYYESIR